MRAALLFLVLATASCVHHTPSAPVTLSGVRPDSVLIAGGVVSEVVLQGRGFAPGSPGQNTVLFGTYAIPGVPANADGSEIRLVIPETIPGGEAPPQPIMPGSYTLRVRAPKGESNSVTVRIYR